MTSRGAKEYTSKMDGLLLIDKSSRWTSFDVVAKVRGIIKKETGQKKPKVGHTGTLDPLATGLLVLTLGSYCKRAGEFSKLDKTYEVTMKLGENSVTGDEEGIKTQVSDRQPDLAKIEGTIQQFTGEIEQIPPAYSAIKVNGQRAYKLARVGKEVTLDPRKITIYEITDVKYEYPEVKFTAKVSSGTYIRSLVEDIGRELGTGAYMSNLRRTHVGKFDIKSSIGIEKLNAEMVHHYLTAI
jgi:tRNA pseudouridine55 synthase